jgi:chemotaxis protein histidine kinase CheA
MRDSDRRMAQRRILDLVRGVRWRWRAKVVLSGLTWVGAISGAVLFLSAVGLEQMRFSVEAVFWFRVLTWGTLTLTSLWFLVRPLLRSPSDEQVALYLEEHEPSLEHAVVSALEAGNSLSPALGQELVASALERAKKIQYGRRVEQSALYRFGGALTVVAVTAVMLTVAGPSHLKHGLSALLVPTKDAAAVNPYAVAVLPGDTTIARGTDQMVTAALSGFQAGEVSIFTRTGPDQTFQRLSMLSDDVGGFEALLLGVDDRTEYFVEATGIRSPTFTIDVADLPYVDQLDLTYYFPRYTGLQPRTREDGGDVAALPGTVVELQIKPTMITPGGKLLMDGEPVEDLTVGEDGSLTVRFTVSERGFYSIELARESGELVPASPEYTIDLLSDQEPSIQFMTPGRDVAASPIEEVYLEVRATDDYGIGDVRLVYSVNGGPEDTIGVFRNSGTPLPEVSTGHTLFLEEWELEPGDLVSYYAVVRDNRGNAKSIESDMFFLNVRPFDIAFRQGEQGGGGGGGGGGGEPETALSELQRQVISATFNLIRQRDSYPESEFSENVVSVSLAQGRLKEQVGTLLERMQNRGLTETDPGFIDVSAILPLAIEAMTLAQTDLESEELREALPDEQTALRYLQQAEETYERYVQEQQQGGGGGGGGSQAAAEDLADLFELELDKLKNQYETVRRGEQQQMDNQVDELMEELQELARRQEQEAERQRRRAQQGQSGGAAGAQSQRDLAEQTEEAARQLQRLARENNDAQMEETARQLQQAAESMRQAASQGGASGTSQANSALRRLEDARRDLREARSERARRDAEEAIERVAELQQQQRDVQRRVREMPTSGQERTETINQLRERKDQMTEAVQALERELDQSASGSRADNPEAARELQGAADQIRESKLKEKLQYSRGTIEQWDPQSAVTLELNIEADLQALRDQLERAANTSIQNEANPLEEALDAARELVRGMESMDRRLAETQQGQEGQQGEGQQGEGQQGEGQQGEGQQGEGQQGEGQQGEGQQGEGQQGQGGQGGEGEQGGQQQGGRGGGRDAMNPNAAQNFGGGATRGNPRPLTDEEIRQFRNEAGQRSDQARELQNQLSEAGYGAGELQAVLEAMNRLEREGTYSDPAQLRMLQQEILNMLKRLEFGLRRDVEGEADRGATLSGSDEVPDGYRKLVEEYYRALARGRSGGSGNGN